MVILYLSTITRSFPIPLLSNMPTQRYLLSVLQIVYATLAPVWSAALP